MGMAASQARYLALVARKSNCEYEGQQINQARTALSNQSANLFNQMLGLQVPVPPSTQDFTKTQYSYTDGFNASTIDSWQQLAQNDENYNYVVTHHYNAEVYTGSQKKLSDPQVQFTGIVPTDSVTYSDNVAVIQQYKVQMENLEADYEAKSEAYQALVSSSKTLSAYRDNSAYNSVFESTKEADGSFNVKTQATYVDNATGKTYTVFEGDDSNEYYYDGKNYYNTDLTPMTATGVILTPKVGLEKSFVPYDATNEDMKAALDMWNAMLKDPLSGNDLYYCEEDGTFALADDLSNLIGQTGGSQTILPTYHVSGTPADGEKWDSIEGMDAKIAQAKAELDAAKTFYDLSVQSYENLSVPDYIGNSELVNLSELTSDQEAEIAQIIKDMEKEGINTNLSKYYDVETGEYNGGIYSFKLNGVTYYTTYDDLAESAVTGNGINNIDGQIKLAYYNADYVTTKIEKTEKALIETDGAGRFTTIRLEDDSITYTLNMETITDDAAYEDAMNQYYYENAKYDKMIQDINAKTSIIHQQDQQLELRLKQLDTEQSALSAEMDAVKNVIKDNVDKSFKTFGG